VSPILVRPVREQLEHDRLIRLLQAKLKRKFDPGINPGAEQNAPVGTPPTAVFPDLVLFSVERGRRLQGVIEVETGESVNHLEALAQWTHLAKLRVPFYLYVPAGMVDVARRLCEDNQIAVTEIWSYHSLGDQVRFALVHRGREVPPVKAAKPAKAPVKAPAAKAKAKPKLTKAPAKAKASPKKKPKKK
jgi:hypothetical protein